MLCEAEVDELQLIESIFPVDAEELSDFMGERRTETSGADVLTVCVGECATKIRQHSTVIIRDQPFEWGMK
jgi:hypothetical protein